MNHKILEISQRNECPNSEDGIHRGVQHKDFGDGCCTCGAYMIFEEDKPLMTESELRREYPREFKLASQEIREKRIHDGYPFSVQECKIHFLTNEPGTHAKYNPNYDGGIRCIGCGISLEKVNSERYS